MPDLETSYSQTCVPNMNHSGGQLGDRTIDAIITEHKEQLDAVLNEFSDLEAVMDDIRNIRKKIVKKKKHIIKSINLHKNFVSTLWRLPTEVLSQIFHYCLPEIGEFQHLKPPSVLEAPMLLTSVCRRWREVAIATPTLWCELLVAIDCKDQWRKRRIFCYKSWLKRSRGCPLSLELFTDSPYNWSKILPFLRPHANRISSLCIHMPFEEEKFDIIDILSPTLQELIIVTLNPTLDEPIFDIDTFMTNSQVQGISQLSALHSLHVLDSSFYVRLLSSFDPALWARLTNITLGADDPDTVLHLFRLAPNLSSFHMLYMLDEPDDGIPSFELKPFTHTKLQSLRITSNHGRLSTRELSKLFDTLSLPNLRVFQVNGEPLWPHAQFKAFLTRSKCPLETLFLGTKVGTRHKQRAEYVALIPSLEILVAPIEETRYFAENLDPLLDMPQTGDDSD
ncbi:hypothetical protein CY34DRAFT_812655 [Suillus luteus UH-Slu-Lm8-n1]|uniref:F-box domain-containing protein n=1 Tax=Suillus luteus UH-Slu-Lm8-n1 TaxID=930992 RepID=A0A0D0AS55_9AGAM|nr:hypothetical protein CY34DRAFT_812655 [Suillus luteus UH-Slu-Lm8-n1]